MNIARIDAATGVVVNIEVADLEWIETNADPAGPWIFVPYDDDGPAAIGDSWDPIGGFTRPPDTYELTGDQLVELGVDVEAVDELLASPEPG